MGRKVLGTVDAAGAFLYLLPGTDHEIRLRLDETLVVGNTDLFDVLIGNRQMKPVADSLVQYPTAQLQLFPNVLESPHFKITLPMTKGPLSPFCAAVRRVAYVSNTNPSARTGPLSWMWGGGSRSNPSKSHP